MKELLLVIAILLFFLLIFFLIKKLEHALKSNTVFRQEEDSSLTHSTTCLVLPDTLSREETANLIYQFRQTHPRATVLLLPDSEEELSDALSEQFSFRRIDETQSL